MSYDIDVLLVGARSTGLTMACLLARQGVNFRIVEKLPGHPTSSRGKAFSGRTQEIFEDLGVVEELRTLGRVDMPWVSYEGGRVGLDQWTRRRELPRPGVPFPYPLQISTPLVENSLRRLLEARHEGVEWGVEFVSCSQDDGGVSSLLRRADGTTESVRSRFVVGCDGGHSTVRAKAGMALRANPVPGSSMYVGDIQLEGLDRSHARIWYSPDGTFLGLCPLPSTQYWQFQHKFDESPDGAEPPTLDLYQRIVDQYCPVPGVRLVDSDWMGVWRENGGVVDRYRVGRVLIAGDAAHVHSPAGGQGANTGIQDAYNLAWKLARVVRGEAADRLLSTYDDERRPTAEAMLTKVGRFNRLFWPANTRRWSFVRRHLILPIMNRRGMVDAMLRAADQLSIGYRGSSLVADCRTNKSESFAGGDRAPDAQLADARTGRLVRLFELFAGDSFTLLVFGDDQQTPARIRAVFPQLVTVVAVVPPDTVITDDEVVHLVDGRERARRAYGLDHSGGGFALVRPDGYVSFLGGPGSEHNLLTHMELDLGLVPVAD